MKALAKNVAIFLYGPPGSGKGTQAKLLCDRFGFYHFDSGDFLRKILNNPENQNNPVIKKEKALNESGKLNTPAWFLGLVIEKIKELIDSKQSIVFSGSIRTMYEAFGDEKTGGLLEVLEQGYGRENIHIFLLQIPEEESIKRNTKRSMCSACGTSLMAGETLKSDICPVCGGKVVYRKDDNEETIKIRLKEYTERTKPIFEELEKRNYKIYKIDGIPAPDKIQEEIVGILLNFK